MKICTLNYESFHYGVVSCFISTVVRKKVVINYKIVAELRGILL